jgi:hypothetical protein
MQGGATECQDLIEHTHFKHRKYVIIDVFMSLIIL